ncbi:MAG: hypothetical protein NTW97_04745, partial [Candidatus Krumholzibacteria bacterium]|nr:hypothetical protein [Candidatus Krumholzibacteria bacterium]
MSERKTAAFTASLAWTSASLSFLRMSATLLLARIFSVKSDGMTRVRTAFSPAVCGASRPHVATPSRRRAISFCRDCVTGELGLARTK